MNIYRIPLLNWPGAGRIWHEHKKQMEPEGDERGDRFEAATATGITKVARGVNHDETER